MFSMEVHALHDDDHFNYDQLPPGKAQELRAIAETLVPLLATLQPTALQAGRQLRSAKKILKHGSFGTFCRAVLKADVRMCQYFINIADLADDLGEDLVGRMPVSAAAALSSAPSDVVSQVLAEMKGGGPCPSARSIKQRVRDSRTSGASSAINDLDVERVAKFASILTTRLEDQELIDLAQFLNTADRAAIAALCEKIRTFTSTC
ncbi:MAG TPA: hypothetical protein VIQ29_25075 [Ancylobacter sp.]